MMARQLLLDDTTGPTAAYCRSACDLIGRNLLELQIVDEAKNKNNDEELLDSDVPRSKYREWFMAMAAQLVDEQHPGYVPAVTAGSFSSNEKSMGNRMDMDTPTAVGVNIPSCKDCGSALQPGHNGSTVRLKRVPPPARKRQPKANKNSNNKSKSADEPLAAWKHSVIMTGNENQHAASTKGCRNKMVLMCGTCQSRTAYPGLALRSNMDGSTKRERERSPPLDKKRFKPTAKTTREEQAADSKAALEDNLDFVPLGDPKKAPEGGSAKKRYADLTALHNPSKKKKAKKPKKPSQLLDFLSSLND